MPALGIRKRLKTGDNILEFTPSSTGTIAFPYWMSMIRSTITVTQ